MVTRAKGDIWPIIILSLEGDDDRRAPLLNSLNARHLSYEIFAGVDGRPGLAPQWQAQIDRAGAQNRLGRSMTDGEFACALSHKAIYNLILDQGWGGAVVLEDDAIIGDNFETFIKSRLYLKGDLILLDHARARVWARSTQILPAVQMHRLAMTPSLTTGYSISRHAAETLAIAATPVRDVADWPCDVSQMRAAALVPPIVGHPNPDFGASYLRDARKKVELTTEQHRKLRAKPIYTMAFWRRWFVFRLTRRVS